MLELYQGVIDVIKNGKRAALATVIASRGSAPRVSGAKMLILEDGSSIGTVGGGGLEQQTREMAVEVIKTGEPQTLHFDMTGHGAQTKMICGGKMDVFIEPVRPQEHLYIFGAGHISQSTAALAKRLGFTVTVIDPRPEYNTPERFPEADMLLNKPYEQAFSELNIGSNDYIVVVTPGHVLDEECLHFALGTPARYIGMIGSKKKTRDVYERLTARGVSSAKLEKVHAPIGLNIGAETPEEIAVSIVAQIVQNKRQGVPKEQSSEI